MQEVGSNIFHEEEDLKGYGISPRNWYLVRGADRSLLVDTSIRTPESLAFMDSFLGRLGVAYGRLDVWITHDHPDHTGLTLECLKRGARIMMNPEESRMKNDLVHCYLTDEESRAENFRIVGVTEEHTPEVFEAVSGYAGEMSGHWLGVESFPYQPVPPGEVLSYGGYRFKVVPLRGHTYGQCGLYDASSGVMFVADQIMRNIVPIVGSQQKDMGLLRAYLQSMGELKHGYRGCRVYPSHFGPIEDLPREADRIIFSYLDKCDRMKQVLEESGRAMTTREVGVRAYGRTDAPPPPGQFKACSMIWAKTFSCLEYLVEEGFAAREERDGILYWRAV